MAAKVIQKSYLFADCHNYVFRPTKNIQVLQKHLRGTILHTSKAVFLKSTEQEIPFSYSFPEGDCFLKRVKP